MNDYYIKIKQNQSEIEFSTSDKEEFNQRLQELMHLAGVLDKIPELQAPKQTEATQKTETPKEEENKSDFEKVLEERLQKPIEQLPPNRVTDKSFEALFERNNIDSAANKIVFTAGYLAEYENKELFTLKDLNRKLVPVTSDPIGHAEINEARMQGLITVMPNYVEKQALTQYVLTSKGEELYNEFDM